MTKAQETIEELTQALEALVSLHQNWYRGSAYVTVNFEKENDAAISAALSAIKSARAGSQ